MTRYEFIWRFIERPKRIIESFFEKLFNLDSNYKLIQKEVNKHRGEIVLNNGYELVELLGWTDYHDDYYYVYYNWRGKYGKIELDTCCGGFTILKGKLGLFKYEHLKEMYKINTPTLKQKLELVRNKEITLK